MSFIYKKLNVGKRNLKKVRGAIILSRKNLRYFYFLIIDNTKSIFTNTLKGQGPRSRIIYVGLIQQSTCLYMDIRS